MLPPQNPLTCQIKALTGAWLIVRCAEGHSSHPPLLMLSKRYPNCTLGCITARLRCKYCKGRPTGLLLSETPYLDNTGMAGAPIGWKIDLLADDRH